MKILDSQGRIFGKVSILDFGAALVILLVIIGLFFLPGSSGSSIAQVNSDQPVEVDVIVRGLSVANPEELLQEFETEKKTNLVIRNQTYGEVGIKSVEELKRMVIVPQPDGSVKALPDPRSQEEALNVDLRMTLTGEAQVTESGVVLGPNTIKIGTPIELEGKQYSFNASVIDVRIVE